ncbi:bifunctional adenosylcobinamide kinase/adenosylcobinamide-phosphate guanylyltransferase [Paenibacillus sp. LHD-38]|uniref:bifunctional adenosylcobinamide kinase/adenosylcobinamide-phosphate guanylyltransferase n=1 Tax=Paenibacillus sp. LHD-38 TaxID=3072143 RepID=UPI0028105BE3|nr:bifunctional adenosylcobinamide kinase/adenosylcobinamide-phosphate guanylyltransferase [Paenibacillus sp. LHD-38]MDQ8735262.1 bifunctional adenosylcobinamide kinase/adenosylcobinamide-phosphate guanylyltransferase [Paenibacillus sp. LHD-38]
MAVLVTGGARSGKSSFAEQYAMRVAARGIYIATCQPYDQEMSERITIHQRDRTDTGYSWETLEVPYDAAEWLHQIDKELSQDAAVADGKKPAVVLLDCLTLWLTNWLMRIEHEALDASRLEIEISKLLDGIQSFTHPLLIVTNEVGDGIVPAYPLGRLFRDEAGRLNQRVAAICERVFLVTAGIPIELKAHAFRWEQL